MHRVQVLHRGLQRAERKSRCDQLAPSGRNRGRLVPEHTAVLSLDGLQSLPGTDLPERLPGQCLFERPDHGRSSARCEHLHRMSILQVELLVWRAAVQRRARGGGQMRHVPQPAGRGARAGLRGSLSGRCHPDRDRKHPGMEERVRGKRERAGVAVCGRQHFDGWRRNSDGPTHLRWQWRRSSWCC
jgi:hypothetical protein